jgi:YD repeat-containing protein
MHVTTVVTLEETKWQLLVEIVCRWRVTILRMGVWQGEAMDSLKYRHGPPCPTLLRPAGKLPLKRPPAGRLLAAVFYPFGHPTTYAYDSVQRRQEIRRFESKSNKLRYR